MPKPAGMGLAGLMAAGAFSVAAILGGCPNDTPAPQTKTCECPNGTVHPYGTTMPCCDGDDCTCTAAPAPKECEYPDGTVHPYGTPMPCCDGEDCTCTVAPPPQPKECECTETDHAAPCDCGADVELCDCTVKANPKVYTLYLDNLVSDMLGEHPIKIEDKTWEVTQGQLDSIQTVLSIMNTAAEAGTGSYDFIIPKVKARDTVKIIVEEGDDFSYNATYNYRVVDGRSIAVNIVWLSSATIPDIGTDLGEGFAEMVSVPLVE